MRSLKRSLATGRPFRLFDQPSNRPACPHPRAMLHSLFLCLTAMLVCLLSGTAFADARSTDANWARFRSVYPLNMQAIAMSQPDASGHRTLVLSEPPPDVTESDLRTLSPLMRQLTVRESMIGVNGVLRDAVIDLPPVPQSDANALVSLLSSRLYGSSYKAYALPISSTAPEGRLAGLDVSLTSNQIWNWLIGDDRERAAEPWTLTIVAMMVLTVLIGFAISLSLFRFRRYVWGVIVIVIGATIVANGIPDGGVEPSPGVLRLQPLQGGAPVSLQHVLDTGAVGVYASAERGFIVWCVARDGDLAKVRDQARAFALDADLVLGGVGGGNYVAIIGRERVNRVDLLPPLRVETIMLLAGADRNELAQSYERNFAFSGPIKVDTGLDWAPIYLSDQLIDTEYGSLLNVTDQMLKSWSMGGAVHYVNFPYQTPSSKSPSVPTLTRVVRDGGAVTFNWNTKGAGYAAQRGDFDVYALHRTGALPIDYLANDQNNVRDTEDAAYDWFATLGDANLARVVQYAALYQLFVHYGIHTQAQAVPAAPRFSDANAQVSRVLKRVAELKLPEPDASAGPDELKAVAETRDLQAALSAFMQSASDSQFQALVATIADPVAFRLAVGKDDEQTQRMIKLSVQVSRWLSRQFVDEDDREMAANAYLKLWDARPSKGWIRTPSIVMSSARLQGIEMTGGHNLSALVLEYRADASVARGSVKFVEQDGKTVALFNEADREGLPRVERIVGRDLETRDLALLERDVESAFQQARLDTRSVDETLHVGNLAGRQAGRGMGGGSIPPGGYRSGWSFAREPDGGLDRDFFAAFETTRRGDPTVIPYVISRDANMQFSVHGADGTFVRASNPPATVDAIRTLAMRRPDGVVHVHLTGMDERSARALMNSAKLKNPAATDVRIIATTDGTMEAKSIQAVLSTRYDWAKVAESVEVSKPMRVGDRVAVDVAVNVPAIEGRAALIVRIRLFFENLADAARVSVEAIQQMVANLRDLDLMWATMKIRHDLHAVYGPLDDTSIHIIDKQNKDFYMVDRSAPGMLHEDVRVA